MPPDWKQYQGDVAGLFRRMGFGAEIELKMDGARGQHIVDVVVRPRTAGIPVLWIVECKSWKAAVCKEQVMTLGHIAQDVGADRAFLLSESWGERRIDAARAPMAIGNAAPRHIARFEKFFTISGCWGLL
ncbi:restriction endonuclease [Bradyrhizobium sp. 200]|nr:restriction endonuclease [Bradyrhizobium sp. 200]